MKRLEGATVIIRFELNHYLIRKKDQRAVDTFSARVVQLRVILPPPGASPATPRRRKVLASDTYFGSFTPSKRSRDDEDEEKEKENKRPSKISRSVILSCCATSQNLTNILILRRLTF